MNDYSTSFVEENVGITTSSFTITNEMPKIHFECEISPPSNVVGTPYISLLASDVFKFTTTQPQTEYVETNRTSTTKYTLELDITSMRKTYSPFYTWIFLAISGGSAGTTVTNNIHHVWIT